MSEVTVDERVEQFIRVRDKIAEIKEKQQKELEPWQNLKDMLEGWLQMFLDKTGQEAARTKHGTAYSSSRTTASLPDADAFMKFVVANSLFDLLDRRANATACKDYVAANGVLPPGVNMTTMKTIGVRRK